MWNTSKERVMSFLFSVHQILNFKFPSWICSASCSTGMLQFLVFYKKKKKKDVAATCIHAPGSGILRVNGTRMGACVCVCACMHVCMCYYYAEMVFWEVFALQGEQVRVVCVCMYTVSVYVCLMGQELS